MSGTTVVPGTPQNSTSIATGDGASLLATITNGATGPTVGATATLQVSADNTTFYSTSDVRQAGTTSAASYAFDFNVSLSDYAAWAYARIQIGGNTAQNVTGTVVASHLSGI